MSDYKSNYSPEEDPQEVGYYGIPALQAPPERVGKVPGGSKPPGSLEKLATELEWLRARVERLEQKEPYND